MSVLQVYWLCQVEKAVFVGNFFIWLNVMDGNFKVIVGVYGVVVVVVVDIFGEVLVDDVVFMFVNVGIFFNSGLYFGIMILVGVWVDFYFQVVFDIGNGVFG